MIHPISSCLDSDYYTICGFSMFSALWGAASTKTSAPTPFLKLFPPSVTLSHFLYKPGGFRENDMGFECTA